MFGSKVSPRKALGALFNLGFAGGGGWLWYTEVQKHAYEMGADLNRLPFPCGFWSSGM